MFADMQRAQASSARPATRNRAQGKPRPRRANIPRSFKTAMTRLRRIAWREPVASRIAATPPRPIRANCQQRHAHADRQAARIPGASSRPTCANRSPACNPRNRRHPASPHDATRGRSAGAAPRPGTPLLAQNAVVLRSTPVERKKLSRMTGCRANSGLVQSW